MTLPEQTHIAPPDASSDAPPRAFGFADRLLAEAVSAFESSNSTTDTTSADEAGRAENGNIEQKIIARAQAHSARRQLDESLRHVRSGLVVVILAAAIMALVGGAATARALLGTPRDEPVNFFLVLLGVLGVQTTLLIVWLLVMLFGHRAAGTTLAIGSLGGVIVRIGQRLAAVIHRGEHHRAAIAACGRTVLDPAMARGTFSAISHGLWLAFNVGCLVMTIVLLSARQYTFAWETTILSADAYVPLTKAVGALPNLAGFGGPTDEQIAASQWTGSAESFTQQPAVSQAWSAMLVGSLVVYGFAPRLLLLAWSLGARRTAKQRYRIDISRPEYLRLEQALMPVSRPLGVTDSDDEAATHRSPVSHATQSAHRTVGPPAILGIEIEAPVPWPPRVGRVKWLDLGFVETREQQHQVIARLESASTEPSHVVALCSLTSTPDRGMGRFIAQLRQGLARPMILVLTGGQSLRQRSTSTEVSQRLADWHQLAEDAGIETNCVVELDLDHLTEASAAKLLPLVDTNEKGGSIRPSRLLEQAFDLIHETVRKPSALMTRDQQIALHHSIARLYRGDEAAWKRWFQLPSTINVKHASDLADSLKSGAAKFADLLPARLRSSPKWLAAGATAGALGCVAAAMMISPVAIGALPLWTGIGAAISGVIGAGRANRDSSSPEPNAVEDRDQAIRSAVMLAMVLELQGHDESAITRILDAAIDLSAKSDMPIDDATITHWLNEMRHRFDLALTSETAFKGAGR